MIQSIKDYLVRLGPENSLVQTALSFHGRRHGYKVDFTGNRITIQKAHRELVLSRAQYVQVPLMLETYDLYFNTIEGRMIGARCVLDFSEPRLHRYTKSKAAFYFPSIPEDDVMDAYLDSYVPNPGDIVWDAGAHAGATAYFFAQMVGTGGRVYAFEPDDQNYDYLEKNIAMHGLTNVIPVKKALAGATGSATFNMDGSMSAGLKAYLPYSDERFSKTVSTISLPDACAEFGEVPQYIKMDIEGAEVVTIDAAQSFLKAHPIHFAIESYHRIAGQLTATQLENLFCGIGYSARSSDKFGMMFTWADPVASEGR